VTDELYESLSPPLSVTSSVTVYVSAAAYVCETLASVAVPPSPKVQLRLAIVPSESVDVSVKVQVTSTQLLVNAAVGATFAGGDAAHV